MINLFYKKALLKIRISRLSTNIPRKTYINGSWVSNSEGSTFDVINPGTGEKICEVPDLSVKEAKYSIECAEKALSTWSKSSALDRSNLLIGLTDLILKHEEELSRIITLENGKSLTESKAEIKYAASFLRWFSEEPRRIMGYMMPAPTRDKKLMILQQPIGVVAMITPWNFPLAMITRKLGALLAAGCTTIIKPSEDTPLSPLKFIEIAQDLIPPGVVNIVTASQSSAPAIGRVFCEDRRVKSLTFTGSSEVGKILYAQSADTMKRLSFELGGNAAVIIFESANLDVAIKGVLLCKFRNVGQACIAANRIIVHESIHEEFVKKLVAETAKFKLGYGLDAGIDHGSLINEEAINKIEKLINKSVELGARVVSGGKRAIIDKYPNGCFFWPTVITGCGVDHPLFKEEIFGPICAISKFSNEEEAVRIANFSNSGLASYLFSEDHRQIWRVSDQLQTGVVGVNEGLISHSETPVSGWKESGLGTEGGIYGIDEFLAKKYICWGNLN